jgi:WD40 repeat protein/tRNA A-37 threonylcarbamoyl transferase component Bud32
MPTMTCPTADRLIAFQTGKLRHDDLNEIAAHVESCTACLTVLERVSTMKDSLVNELRQARPRDGFSEEPDCRRALNNAAALLGDSTHTRDETADAAPPADLSRTMLGKYQLLGVLGQGGMGTVYKAVHTLLKRTVALKVLPPNRLKNPVAVSRFRREIEAAGRLDHPHIVRTSDADEADGHHFLVMEWLAGQDLAKEVRERGPLPIAQACDFIRQAALGLECAHQHGMVHRDVKPSNLLVTKTAEGTALVKVLDLGLALLQTSGNSESDLTGPDHVMGTYDYIAPEQATNAHEVDGRADIYSLGCTLYFLLTGKAPFQGKTETQKLLAHQCEEPAPIAQFRPEIPRAVTAIVKKMMAKEPSRRYATMRDVADALTKMRVLPAPRSRLRAPLFAAAAALLALFVGGVTIYPQIVIRIKGKEGDTEITLPKDIGVDVLKDKKVIASIPGDAKPAKDNAKKPSADSAMLDKKKEAAPMPTPAKGAVALHIMTKLGIESQVEVRDIGLSSSQANVIAELMFSRTDTIEFRRTHTGETGLGRVCLDMGKGIYVFIPIHQVTRIDAADNEHVVTLLDATTHRGRLLTAITTNDGKTHQLSDAKSVKVLTATPVKPDEARAPKTLLTVGNTPYRLSAYAFHAGPFGFGQRFRMDVDGANLEPDLSDFNKVVVTPSPEGKWRIAVTAPAGQETNGILNTSTSRGPRWYLLGEMRNGWLILVAYFNGNPGFSLEKLKQESPKKADASPGKADHTDGVTHLAISRNGSKLLTATADQRLWFWSRDADDGKLHLQWKMDMPRVQAITLDPAGANALIAINGNSRLTHVNTQTQEAKDKPGRYGATAVEFSADGRRYITGTNYGGFTLFDWPDAEPLREFAGRDHPVRQLCFSRDGKRILSVGNDKTIRLWNVADAEELKRVPTLFLDKTVAALSFDATHALITQNNVVHVWNLNTLKISTKLDGHEEHVTALALTPDGRTAVTASRDKTLRGWDLGTGKGVFKLDGHDGDITCVSVSAEGRHIVSGSRDKTLRVWAWPK